MTIKPAGQILTEEIDSVVAELKSCVTPIFDVNDKGEAELLGSGVLIAVGGGTFLCTAKHVIDGNATSTLYLDGPTKMEALEGDFYSTAEHDIAVVKLSAEQVTLLQKYSPLAEEHIGGPVDITNSKYAALVGFPETKNRKVYKKNEIAGLIYSIGGTVKEATLAKVRVVFDTKRNIDAETRKSVRAPDPHGMSGGAMFGVAVNSATVEGKPKPKLIGIMTDWLRAEKEIFGSSSAIALAIVKEAWGTELPQRLQSKDIKVRVAITRAAGATEVTFYP
jgi:Trypsin-like peptidase domain